ncbi:hypothetical protein I3256_06945 [Photobacterium damselae]|uniref:hypothetical protein n=1 Tax=Photobacterium damselae TaxID=38293 RepID=UPI001EDE5420|nr:hypothetical protein [Photobacterium damselae]MCG3815667.1 hypothetical protein [Photobacterium damselae]
MTKRTAHNRNFYLYQNQMLSIMELSELGAKINPKTIKSRLQLGWSLEDAVEIPLQDTSITNATHGMRDTPEYSSWRSMKDRILNEKNPSYKYYGARGLTIEPEWVESFEAFIAEIGLMPEPKEEYSVDRIDNSRGYHKGNVRWSTLEEQARNKSNNIYENYRGDKRLLIELAEEHNIKYRTLYSRLYLHGWDIEQALNTPVQEQERLYFFQGELRNLVVISEMTGKTYSTLHRRVTELGMTIDEAVETDPFPKLLIHGEMLSKNQICEKYDIAFVTLNKRLEKGMSPEEAVADQTERKLYKGEWLSRKELAKATGIGIDTINRRWRKGFPIEDLVKPPTRKMAKHLHKGNMRSISEVAKMENIPNSTLARHIRNGMSLDEALAYIIASGR